MLPLVCEATTAGVCSPRVPGVASVGDGDVKSGRGVGADCSERV